MVIAISQSVLFAEHASHYITQLKLEGDEITIVTEIDKNDPVFGMYICDNLDELISLVGIVKYLLFFSTQCNRCEKEPEGITRVGSWWEIYNYIRYEM